jgi:hypoxanthine phosphoribosyltransferase
MLKKLYSKKDIKDTVKKLAQLIEKDFPGEEIVFICLLKGSFMFTSDLVRCIGNPTVVDFMRVSSYGGAMKTTGKVQVLKDIEEKIEGRNVIIVEDIIDSGLTLKSVIKVLEKRKPKSLKVCALVDKRARREVKMEGDYVGFTLDDGFIVGYGIDHAEQYRNYPEIYVITT